MNNNDIDKHILLIANNLKNISKEEINKTYLNNGFTVDEIFLLVSAAELLNNDRINTKPTKKLFKRVI